MNVNKNLLVTLADENYVEQAKQLFSSVYWNAGWKGDYMLLAHEIPEKKLKWFRDKEILIRKCKPLYKKPVGFLKHPPVILDKFYIFTSTFKKWKNIVYLDADMIVRASLDDLTRVKRFAATNIKNRKLSNHFLNYKKINKKIFDKLINNLKKYYNLNRLTFNSGVLVFDTKIIKKNTFNEMIKLFKEYETIDYSAEETSLNLFFYKKWERISFLYNLFPEIIESNYFIKPKRIEGIVIHFTGKNKPWLTKSPFYEEWKNNLEKANLINLKKIPSSCKTWSKKYIKRYSIILKKRKVFHMCLLEINKYKGLIGIFLKKHHLKLYYSLKNKLKND